jgi:hypothetical protein
MMSERKPSEVLGALPRTRPHRRSDKRAARPTATPLPPKPPAPAAPTRSRVAAQKAAKPEPEPRSDILGTAVQAAAELAEIGLSASARALRGAVSRLPRP